MRSDMSRREENPRREADMATGGTSGEGRPRRVISAGGGRRRPEQGEPGEPGAQGAAPEAEAPEDAEAKPIVAEIDPELERILAEEEEIERRTRQQHHEAPHFRQEGD